MYCNGLRPARREVASNSLVFCLEYSMYQNIYNEGFPKYEIPLYVLLQELSSKSTSLHPNKIPGFTYFK